MALIADVGPQWLRICGALNSVGMVDVPRGTDATSDDLKYILGHSEARAVFLQNRAAYDKLKSTLSELAGLKYIFFFENETGLDIPAEVAALSLEDGRSQKKPRPLRQPTKLYRKTRIHHRTNHLAILPKNHLVGEIKKPIRIKYPCT